MSGCECSHATVRITSIAWFFIPTCKCHCTMTFWSLVLALDKGRWDYSMRSGSTEHPRQTLTLVGNHCCQQVSAKTFYLGVNSIDKANNSWDASGVATMLCGKSVICPRLAMSGYSGDENSHRAVSPTLTIFIARITRYVWAFFQFCLISLFLTLGLKCICYRSIVLVIHYEGFSQSHAEISNQTHNTRVTVWWQ